MFLEALFIASPMIVFVTGVAGIIAAPHIKRACYLAKDHATKGRSNPDVDAYALIAGSMLQKRDEWKIERGSATWPKPPASFQYHIEIDEKTEEVTVRMQGNGTTRKVDGYWAALFRDQVREQAAQAEREMIFRQLFPDGSGPLLLSKQ